MIGSDGPSAKTNFPAIRQGVVGILFPLIYLQKIGFNAGGGIPLTLIVLYLVLGMLLLRGHLSISAGRLAMFLLFCGLAVLSQLFAGSFSVLSLGFMVSIYLPFIIVWTLHRDQWLILMRVFQNLMLLPAGMVFVQVAWQYSFHWQVLSIAPFIPVNLSMPGFIYQAPLHWGQPFMRPNGFFMLEPSFISAFSASALVIELVLFHRFWRLAWYGAAMVASTGATGLVLAGVALPFVLARQRFGLVLFAVLIALALVPVGIEMGAIKLLAGRVAELGSQNSSGFDRLVAPLIQLGDIVDDPANLVVGSGAGSSNRVAQHDASTWPVIKLAIEYGMATALAFFVFIVACCLNSPMPALTASLFFVFNFTGGYLQNSPMTILMLMLSISFRVMPEGEPATAARVGQTRSRSEPPGAAHQPF